MAPALYAFRVTWETVTDESAEHGDAESRGFLDAFGDRIPVEGEPGTFRLRDALAMVDSALPNTAEVAAIVPDQSPGAPRSISWHCGRDWRSGKFETVTLHIPETVSRASRERIRNLCHAI